MELVFGKGRFDHRRSIANELAVTPRAALRIVEELGVGDDGEGEVSGVGNTITVYCPRPKFVRLFKSPVGAVASGLFLLSVSIFRFMNLISITSFDTAKCVEREPSNS
jgi:hypothetical protein